MSFFKNTSFKCLTALCLFAFAFLYACNNAKRKGKDEPKETHQVMVKREGGGMLYADKVSCNAVMQTTDSAGNTTFHCYVVGIIDSLAMAKATDKKDIEAGKYYQFDMQRDWVAVVGGDSLLPVFYQPKQRLQNHRYEGIIVFETPKGSEPEMLEYRDSYSSWGTQQLALNSNKK